MFSTFPGGWPGAGLLLLRASIGVTSFAQGLMYAAHWQHLAIRAQAAVLLAAVIGVLLSIGYLTPLASALAGCIGIAAACFGFQALASVLATSMAVSILFLGPGAFSIDARLFGRREIIIPTLPAANRAKIRETVNGNWLGRI
jgi:putative oxidoreductase